VVYHKVLQITWRTIGEGTEGVKGGALVGISRDLHRLILEFEMGVEGRAMSSLDPF
jgi:hypothetical protein